jgi:hypothetical protein
LHLMPAVAAREVSTDDHRCGIDPLNRFTSNNWPSQRVRSGLVERATVSRARQKCRPHRTMDRPRADKSNERGTKCYATQFIGDSIRISARTAVTATSGCSSAATGPGWQTRINDTLRRAANDHFASLRRLWRASPGHNQGRARISPSHDGARWLARLSGA